MSAPHYASDAVTRLRAELAAEINAERARRAADACCNGTGRCGERECQIASAVDDVLADAADMVAGDGGGGRQ